MRILQVTNIVSHHQLPLAHQIAKTVGPENFRFVATRRPDPGRARLGWNDHTDEPWILRAGENDEYLKSFEQWWDEADVVICGERLFDRMRDRLRQNKLTFHMSERWWKPPIGMARLLHPRFALMTARLRSMASSRQFHFLPMGGYAALDMYRIAAFTGRMWQWGYFTAVPQTMPGCDRRDQGYQILWAGRMLLWKRVDSLVKAFAILRRQCPHAFLMLVGDGPERGRLEQLATRMLAPDSFRFLPPVPPTEIRQLMRQSHVYVLPSNGYEGWGAVINEAMTEGCCVVASVAVGAAKTMIRHNENGLLFSPGNVEELGNHLIRLGKNDVRRTKIASAGQQTIVHSWSPAVAAERFVLLCEALLGELPVPNYSDGPLAPIWEGVSPD